MKYTVPSARAAARAHLKSASTKKYGYFASENNVVKWIREKTGLQEAQRHPLTWLMEACDDIAYSILDVEDSIKKSIVSPEDLLAYLKRQDDTDIRKMLTATLDKDFEKADGQSRPTQASEIKTSYVRTRLIETLLTSAADAYVDSRDAIFRHENTEPLLDRSSACSDLCEALKKFAFSHAYTHPSVLRIELQGAAVISKLMDWLWRAIIKREDVCDLSSKRTDPFSSYVYSLISDNYRYIFEEGYGRADDGRRLPIRYREMQLLTDMVSGMTDGFAMNLFDDLEPLSRA